MPPPVAKIENRKFFSKRIPLGYVILITLTFCVIFYWRNNKLDAGTRDNRLPVIEMNTNLSPSEVKYRANNYQFARPLLLTDASSESEKLSSLKNDLNDFIKNKRKSGKIINASVYVERLNDSQWRNVNDDLFYTPGSLMKVPTMMIFLRESEIKPELLNKEIFYSKVPGDLSVQTFNSGSIEPGMNYTIRKLLYFMIAKSDNHSTMLLDAQLSYPMLNQLFADLGLPAVDNKSTSYSITASGYSRFLRMLYNATYISNEDADFALSLLTESTFTKGLSAGLPDGTKIAHKFGEAGSATGGRTQLHESGIVFMDNNPYLITVMTRGLDVELLPEIISEISSRVYKEMTLLAGNS